jgi:ATP phosphoribosyltransferase (homohexameric) (EC 2.4.2.17)
MSNKITIALSKGRILKQTLPLFERLGIVPTINPSESRSLIIPSTDKDVQFIIVRSSDAPTYVRLGAADIGVVGKDTLMEMDGAGVVELMDLNIAKCRISVAGPSKLRIAKGLIIISFHGS